MKAKGVEVDGAFSFIFIRAYVRHARGASNFLHGCGTLRRLNYFDVRRPNSHVRRMRTECGGLNL